MSKYALALLGGIFAVASPAQAFCEYNDVMYAKTTIAQEFKDSRWVVRAHITSADYHWSDEDESWVLYRLKVITSFKGHLSSRFTFFTMRNSGGFYMDGKDAVPDLDEDYLLFLVPYGRDPGNPRQSWKALWVNYACGQSKAWPKVTAAEQKELQTLSAQSTAERRNRRRSGNRPVHRG